MEDEGHGDMFNNVQRMFLFEVLLDGSSFGPPIGMSPPETNSSRLKIDGWILAGRGPPCLRLFVFLSQ